MNKTTSELRKLVLATCEHRIKALNDASILETLAIMEENDRQYDKMNSELNHNSNNGGATSSLDPEDAFDPFDYYVDAGGSHSSGSTIGIDPHPDEQSSEEEEDISRDDSEAIDEENMETDSDEYQPNDSKQQSIPQADKENQSKVNIQPPYARKEAKGYCKFAPTVAMPGKVSWKGVSALHAKKAKKNQIVDIPVGQKLTWKQFFQKHTCKLSRKKDKLPADSNSIKSKKALKRQEKLKAVGNIEEGSVMAMLRNATKSKTSKVGKRKQPMGLMFESPQSDHMYDFSPGDYEPAEVDDVYVVSPTAPKDEVGFSLQLSVAGTSQAVIITDPREVQKLDLEDGRLDPIGGLEDDPGAGYKNNGGDPYRLLDSISGEPKDDSATISLQRLMRLTRNGALHIDVGNEIFVLALVSTLRELQIIMVLNKTKLMMNTGWPARKRPTRDRPQDFPSFFTWSKLYTIDHSHCREIFVEYMPDMTYMQSSLLDIDINISKDALIAPFAYMHNYAHPEEVYTFMHTLEGDCLLAIGMARIAQDNLDVHDAVSVNECRIAMSRVNAYLLCCYKCFIQPLPYKPFRFRPKHLCQVPVSEMNYVTGNRTGYKTVQVKNYRKLLQNNKKSIQDPIGGGDSKANLAAVDENEERDALIQKRKSDRLIVLHYVKTSAWYFTLEAIVKQKPKFTEEELLANCAKERWSQRLKRLFTSSTDLDLHVVEHAIQASAVQCTEIRAPDRPLIKNWKLARGWNTRPLPYPAQSVRKHKCSSAKMLGNADYGPHTRKSYDYIMNSHKRYVGRKMCTKAEMSREKKLQRKKLTPTVKPSFTDVHHCEDADKTSTKGLATGQAPIGVAQEQQTETVDDSNLSNRERMRRKRISLQQERKSKVAQGITNKPSEPIKVDVKEDNIELDKPKPLRKNKSRRHWDNLDYNKTPSNSRKGDDGQKDDEEGIGDEENEEIDYNARQEEFREYKRKPRWPEKKDDPAASDAAAAAVLAGNEEPIQDVFEVAAAGFCDDFLVKGSTTVSCKKKGHKKALSEEEERKMLKEQKKRDRYLRKALPTVGEIDQVPVYRQEEVGAVVRVPEEQPANQQEDEKDEKVESKKKKKLTRLEKKQMKKR